MERFLANVPAKIEKLKTMRMERSKLESATRSS
jgi:hypothetical protein